MVTRMGPCWTGVPPRSVFWNNIYCMVIQNIEISKALKMRLIIPTKENKLDISFPCCIYNIYICYIKYIHNIGYILLSSDI